MRRARCTLLLSLMLFSALASAADPKPQVPARGERLLHQIGKQLALAAEDEQLRSRLHKLLNETPYVEGRVALKRVLGDNAELRSLLLGKAGADWNAAAAALPELELYFPSKQHRSEWTGKGPVDVAVAIGGAEGDRYRVYSQDGAVREIAGGKAPATPTLLLGKSEIDYDDLESALVGGKRTGPYLERLAQAQGAGGCGTAKGGQPGAPTSATAESMGSVTAQAVDTAYDTFYTLLRIKNDYEGWPRGSNEIEIFGNVDGVASSCARVTDIDEDRDYYYTLGTRRVSTAAPTDPSYANITLYEDDDDGCSIQGGDDYIGAASQTRGQFGNRQYYTNFDITLEAKPDSICGDSVCEAGESIYCCECSYCGDLFCNPSCGESNFTCGYDCTCGNFYCDFGEDYWSCPNDCTCGNFVCDFGEDQFSCPQDC